jgi:tripeptidyl-peptidase-1
MVAQSHYGGWITSGGGFSTRYEVPTWQSKHMTDYFTSLNFLKEHLEPGFNAKGRGYPDLAAAALNYEEIENGKVTLTAGTSASTPVVAGLISLANSARIKAGKGPLGFLNPMLYSLYKKFTNDITVGKNQCIAAACWVDGYCSVSLCCNEGFYALPGWDPITGLGSLNYTAFEDVVIKLGAPKDPNHHSAAVRQALESSTKSVESGNTAASADVAPEAASSSSSSSSASSLSSSIPDPVTVVAETASNLRRRSPAQSQSQLE